MVKSSLNLASSKSFSTDWTAWVEAHPSPETAASWASAAARSAL